MASTPTASIVVPTRGRPAYLEVTLASVTPQAQAAHAEVWVISDGPNPASEQVARRFGASFLALDEAQGLNRVRNAGIEATTGDPVVFIDDDVDVPSGWLTALLRGVETNPDCDVFGGPIRARLEGSAPRGCGREPAPITTQDFGEADRDVPIVWGANMSIRRRALTAVGTFNDALSGGGDEEEWEQRYLAAGGRIRYLAAAGLEHRRSAADSRLRALARAGFARGREARRNDVRKGAAPAMRVEIRTLLGCGYHVIRRRCAIGLVLGAHAAGRLSEALRGGGSRR